MPCFARAIDATAAAFAAALVMALATPARAETSDKALAESLFQEGRSLFEAGDYRTACDKFAASQRVEAKLGTLLNLAACHEASGQTASAWAEFTEAETEAVRRHEDERQAFARERLATIEPHLSRVLITVSSQGLPLDVELDGTPLDPAAIGAKFPADPGEHALRVSAVGMQTWTTTFRVPLGPASTQIDVPPLVPETAATTDAGAATTPMVSTPAASSTTGRPRKGAPTPRPPPPAPDDTRDALAWSSFGIGAVAVGVGTYYGLLAYAKNADGNHTCDASGCSGAGLAAFDDARSAATASTLFFAVGLAAVTAGAILLLTHSSTTTGAARAAARGTALEVSW